MISAAILFKKTKDVGLVWTFDCSVWVKDKF